MKASPDLMLFSRVMLGVFVALGIVSVVMTVRLFFQPADADTAKLAADKRNLIYSSWIAIPIFGTAIHAVATHEYGLLFVSALLFTYILPILVRFLRTRAAVKSTALTL